MMTFAGLSLAMIVGFAFLCSHQNKNDYSSDLNEHARHTRQDVRLIVFLLGGILFTLGVIADKLR